MSKERVTSGAAWRKPREEGYVVRLPSGNMARLRPVALDMLIVGGKLPDLLTPIAAKSLWTETDTATLGDQVELAKGYAELVNLIVPNAMMDPVIVEKPEADNEITLDDLEFSDKVAIFQLASGGTTLLKNFREQQAPNVESVRNGESHVPEAQPVDRDR